jgi:hypothetical protein
MAEWWELGEVDPYNDGEQATSIYEIWKAKNKRRPSNFIGEVKNTNEASFEEIEKNRTKVFPFSNSMFDDCD